MFVGRQAEGAVKEESGREKQSGLRLQRRRRRRLLALALPPSLHPSFPPSLLPSIPPSLAPAPAMRSPP